MTDEPMGRAVPTTLPDDTIRVMAESVELVLGPDGDGINLGLLVRAAPTGSLRFTLTEEQAMGLYLKLLSMISLTPEQVTAVVSQIHNNPTD